MGERLGFAARTLSGDEEAALTYAGATALRPPDDPTERLVIDIGGGSTELVRGARGRIGFHVSTQIGVVRHSERHLRSDPPAPAELAALCADVDAALAAAVPAAERAPVRAAIAVAGTATSCAAIDLALDPYDAARVEGHVLPRARLEEQLDAARGAPAGRAARRDGPAPRPRADDRRRRGGARPGARRVRPGRRRDVRPGHPLGRRAGAWPR